jgi:deazaflavin-dependent oxidoreductase (nitroreductase family)
LLCRLAGRRLITIYVVGRKTGRRYAIPVAYTHHANGLLVGTQFSWVRNLRDGEPVEIRLQGKRQSATVQLVSDPAGVVECYSIMARDNRQFAKFNKIGYDERGLPRQRDLELAWAAGARALLLRPLSPRRVPEPQQPEAQHA